MSENVVIVVYNEDWPNWFEQLKAKLTKALGNLIISIDHIGSTSVPGLSSKNRIDVQVTVKEISKEMQNALDFALQADGFQVTQFGTDHRPPKDTGEIEEWQKFFLPGDNPELPFSSNIHIRAKGRQNQQYALIFRDYLRAHPKAANAYQKVKEVLALYHRDNMQAYVEIKDPVCDIIMTVAWDWAKRSHP